MAITNEFGNYFAALFQEGEQPRGITLSQTSPAEVTGQFHAGRFQALAVAAAPLMAVPGAGGWRMEYDDSQYFGVLVVKADGASGPWGMLGCWIWDRGQFKYVEYHIGPPPRHVVTQMPAQIPVGFMHFKVDDEGHWSWSMYRNRVRVPAARGTMRPGAGSTHR